MRNLLILMVLFTVVIVLSLLITKIITEIQQDHEFKLCHGLHVFPTKKCAVQTDVQHLKKTVGLLLYV